MLNKVAIIVILFVINQSVYSQKDSISVLEESLKELNKTGHLILNGETDAIRDSSNIAFTFMLEKSLNIDSSMRYSFDSVKNISIQIAPDNTFRLITWIKPKRDGSHFNYYGYLQTFNKKKKTSKLYSLTDKSETIDNPQLAKLTPANWYGALYYKMISCKRNGKKYYTLLGAHWINNTKTEKLIDVLTISGDKINFGFPFFKTEKKTLNRPIFTYAKDAAMSLKYDESSERIVFDDLAPSDTLLVGQFEFYGPDGKYNAFKYKSGSWRIQTDIDIRNNSENHGIIPKKNELHPPPIHNPGN